MLRFAFVALLGDTNFNSAFELQENSKIERLMMVINRIIVYWFIVFYNLDLVLETLRQFLSANCLKVILAL